MSEESFMPPWGKDLQRGSVGSRPNLQSTLFMPTEQPDNPLSVGFLLRACLEEFRALAERVALLEQAHNSTGVAPERDLAQLPVAQSHTQLVCRPSGYSFHDIDTPPPLIGERVEVSGEIFVVDRLARSPFPADARPCAILVRVAASLL
jgi:hypothetical protein